MKNITFFFFFIPIFSFATHMRSGEITYRCLGGYTYEITLTTYTKGSAYMADRCYEQMNFGDDTVHYYVCRCNYEAGDPATDPWGATSCTKCTAHHMGEWSMFSLCLDIKKNVFCVTHTFAGQGNYVISFFESNRMNGIINIGTGIPLYIADTLYVSPFITCNNSPVCMNPIPDTAHVGICYSYNQSAIDPDGDSLSYKLISCMDTANHPITGYFFPSGISMNSLTGDLTWCSPPPIVPPAPNLWNFAINIEEWRKVANNYTLIGTSMRDIQIFVEACAGMAVHDIVSELPGFTVFPNPSFSDEITFDLGKNKFPLHFEVFDYSGKKIADNTITQKLFSLNIHAYSEGLYVFLLTNPEQGFAYGKFEKSH
jgi:hypothetical protein